jgi:hypothetical protein
MVFECPLIINLAGLYEPCFSFLSKSIMAFSFLLPALSTSGIVSAIKVLSAEASDMPKI